METKFTDFYDAWWWLQEHKAFRNPIIYEEYYKDTPELADCMSQSFMKALDIDFQKVNPLTNRIDDDPTLNTKTECWLECGGAYVEGGHCYFYHDINLDCGGDTFEEAIIKLANLVSYHYNDDGTGIEERSWINND